MSIRLANLGGRAQLVVNDSIADVERVSNGRFPADPMAALAVWDALREWGETVTSGAVFAATSPIASLSNAIENVVPVTSKCPFASTLGSVTEISFRELLPPLPSNGARSSQPSSAGGKRRVPGG